MSDSVFSKDFITVIKARRAHKCLIPIQKEGTNIPFFAVPGLLLYRHLSRYLGEDQPFYVFEPMASYNQNKGVKDVAMQFIAELRTARPNGPYLLGAFCMHYPVVFEMARELVDMGEEVPLVVLIDSYAPDAVISKKSHEYWFKKLNSVYTRLKKHPTRHKPAFLLNELKKAFVYSYKKLLFNKEEEYEPTPYPGKVVLFKSSDPGPVFTEDSQMGWSNFLTGEKEIITIEGDHVDILKEPAVIEFAEKLTNVFNQVNRHN